MEIRWVLSQKIVFENKSILICVYNIFVLLKLYTFMSFVNTILKYFSNDES